MSVKIAAPVKAGKKSADGLPIWTDEDINNSRASCNDQENGIAMEAFNDNSRVPLPKKTFGLRENLASFWQKSKGAFSKMWLDLPHEQKCKLLRTISPYMPESPENPVVDGIVMHGVLAFAPEMTLSFLTANGGLGLLQLMEHRATHDMFDIMWESRPHIEEALRLRRLKRRRKPNEFAYFEGEKAGETLVPNSAQGLKELKKIAQKGFLWPAEEYFLCMERENIIITTLCMLAHEYKITWKGKGSRVMTAVVGCHNCAATNKPGGGALKECADCRRAYYCSRECQKAHWKEHKEQCREISRQRKEREARAKKREEGEREEETATNEGLAEEVGSLSLDDKTSVEAPGNGGQGEMT